MGLFGQSTPFDADIEKATSETNTNENWSLILDVCDKVTSNPRSAKDCLKAVMRRMGHADPHVVMQAITLLDACVNNCGKSFHLEIASRDFENEFRRLLAKAQPKVSARMRQVLKSWAEGDFKSDPELSLIPALYQKLRGEGYEFNNLAEKPKSATRATALSKDPNVVSTQQEEDDIAKAIELSLKENKSSPKQQQQQLQTAAVTTTSSSSYPSLYPSVTGGLNVSSTTASTTATVDIEPRKVRALYDFEAAEDNELTFYAGEILHVLDDSDPNWWKGCNQRGEGLFPSNFVTADLSADPERIDINLSKNKVDEALKAEQERKIESELDNQRIDIDEMKVDRLLHLLHEANPEDRSQDTEEMLRLEQEVHQMGPLIDAELERVDRKHAQLTQLSSDLVDAINMYHSLMRDDRAAMMSAGAVYMPTGMPLPGMPGIPPNSYQGNTNPPQMLFGAYAGGHFPHLPHAPTSTMPAGMNYQPPAMHNAIPMQYQNGHTTNNVMPQMMYAPQQQQQQQPPQPHAQQAIYASTGQQQHPQQQQLPPASQLQQQHHQQQQHQMPIYAQHQPTQQVAAAPAQFMPASVQHTTTTGTADITASHNGTHFISTTQQQQQQPPPTAIGGYMQIPLQQQQQQQQQHLQHLQQSHQPYVMSNGVQGGFMPTPPAPINNNNAGLNPDQLNQLQQQMAAMAMGMGNQPVTQNFLVQNEPKNNIPIYQQQR